MRIKGLKDEDFTNYLKPSMFIITPFCDFKCDKENGCSMCQNSHLAHESIYNVDDEKLIQRYMQNDISQAIVFGGLEPFDTFNELLHFITLFRATFLITDEIVIYTGYNKDEIKNELTQLKEFSNIIVKFGRYVPNQQSHIDPILGVVLASPNQYAERIS